MVKIKKITKNTTLAEILGNPKTKTVLLRYNFPCLRCPLSVYESKTLKIGEVAKLYNFDVDNLLKDLNKKAK